MTKTETSCGGTLSCPFFATWQQNEGPRRFDKGPLDYGVGSRVEETPASFCGNLSEFRAFSTVLRTLMTADSSLP